MAGSLDLFASNDRCYSSSSTYLISHEDRRRDTEVGKRVRRAESNPHGQPGSTGVYNCMGRSAGLKAAQAEMRGRVVHSPSNIRESGSEGNCSIHNDLRSNQSSKSSAEFNAHIISMFPPAGGKSSDIDLFVNDWLPECTAAEVSNFMRIAGKKSRVKSHLHLKRHLPTIASRIEDLSLVSWKPIDRKSTRLNSSHSLSSRMPSSA